MERKLKEVKLDSAKTFSELYGLKDQSPLIGVIDFKTAQKSPNNLEMEYGVYALYLKDVSVFVKVRSLSLRLYERHFGYVCSGTASTS